jgi:hypothetical protein
MPRRTKQSRIDDARIQRAVAGFRIPITSIVLLNKQLEAAIASGADDHQLRDVVAFHVYGHELGVPHTTELDLLDAAKRNADRVDGYDRDDLGESPDY